MKLGRELLTLFTRQIASSIKLDVMLIFDKISLGFLWNALILSLLPESFRPSRCFNFYLIPPPKFLLFRRKYFETPPSSSKDWKNFIDKKLFHFIIDWKKRIQVLNFSNKILSIMNREKQEFFAEVIFIF